MHSPGSNVKAGQKRTPFAPVEIGPPLVGGHRPEAGGRRGCESLSNGWRLAVGGWRVPAGAAAEGVIWRIDAVFVEDERLLHGALKAEVELLECLSGGEAGLLDLLEPERRD